MNMSGNYSGYYQSFGPPMPPFGPPNGRYRPSYPPNMRLDFNPTFPPNRPRPPQEFAEYSLWGDSGPFDCLPLPNYHQPPPRPTYPPRSDEYTSFSQRDRPTFRVSQDDDFRPSFSHRTEGRNFTQRSVSRSPFLQLNENCNGNISPRILSPRAETSNANNHFLIRTECPKVFVQGLNTKPPFSPAIEDKEHETAKLVSPKPQTDSQSLQSSEPSNFVVKVDLTSDDSELSKPKACNEEKDQNIMIIEKEALYIHPDNFNFDEEMDFALCNEGDMEQSSNSSGSSGDWTNSNFKRAGDQPVIDRPSRLCNNRGRKGNIMQRRLVRALAQPAKIDKGASMLQRMGWIGGGLGKDGSGIVDPITPNAFYATTTAGFGQEIEAIQRLPTKKQNRSPCVKKQRSKKLSKEHFKTNLLLHILRFVRNDLLQELYFEETLNNGERKRIHRVVAALQGTDDSGMQLTQQQNIVDDILNSNSYVLCTESEGEGASRKICVFKEAPGHMFLVTPDDCRPCETESNKVVEEPNPFLASITKHMKDGEASRATPLRDKLAQFFIEFCKEQEYTEFRFLGPFTKKEVQVLNSFLALIRALAAGEKPQDASAVPIELSDQFHTEYRYYSKTDANGSISIVKVHVSDKEEYEKQREEERQKLLALRNSSYYSQESTYGKDYC